MMQDNVLVDENGTPMLSDLGLTRVIDSRASAAGTSFKGDGCIQWQAPEILQPTSVADGHNLTTRTDVYALACVMLEVCIRLSPESNVIVITSLSLQIRHLLERFRSVIYLSASQWTFTLQF